MDESRLSSIPGSVFVAATNDCPYCTELLGPDLLHICPAGCCYVGGFEERDEIVCPYCKETFAPSAGHVCLELIALTSPVQ